MSGQWGSPTAMTYMDEFQTFVEENFALGTRPAIFGFSRGGAYAANYAYAHPDRVGIIYLDAPLTDLALLSEEEGRNAGWWAEMLRSYGLTEETFWDYHDYPNDHAAQVGKNHVPMLVCLGLADQTVPVQSNFYTFYERYLAGGGREEDVLILTKPNGDHHPHSFDDAAHVKQMADFIEEHRVVD